MYSIPPKRAMAQVDERFAFPMDQPENFRFRICEICLALPHFSQYRPTNTQRHGGRFGELFISIFHKEIHVKLIPEAPHRMAGDAAGVALQCEIFGPCRCRWRPGVTPHIVAQCGLAEFPAAGSANDACRRLTSLRPQ
jgi:hypothetical protein